MKKVGKARASADHNSKSNVIESFKNQNAQRILSADEADN